MMIVCIFVWLKMLVYLPVPVVVQLLAVGAVLAVQVPCDPGTFGDDCSGQCHCRSGPAYCRTLDGRCTDGICSYGWAEPPYCQTACPAGTFGSECALTCHCPDGDTCSNVNGICRSSSCAYGWGGASCQRSMPILLKPPSVGTSSDGRYLVIKWPAWLANITGNGTGPVVSYTLQGLAQLGSTNWQNLTTSKQQQLSTAEHPATTASWFTYLAKDLIPNTGYKFRIQLASRPGDKDELSWPGPASVNWTLTPCAVPVYAPSDVAAYIDYINDSVRVIWTHKTAAECIVHHNVTLSSSDSSCVDISVLVPWPGTSASLNPPSSWSCRGPVNVSVRAVNSAGLAGPTATVVVVSDTTMIRDPLTNSTEKQLLFQTTSLTTVDPPTTTLHSTPPTALDNETLEYISEGELIYSSCINGSEPCLSRPVNSQLCSVYVLSGRVSIVNRTETTIAVQLVSSFNIPLHSALILMSIESLGGGSVPFEVPRLQDGVIHITSLTPACLYRVIITVVLPRIYSAGTWLSSRCVNVSVSVSTSPSVPATPPPPSRVHDFRNGSVLVVLSSVRRHRRDVYVVSSRLIVVEYTDAVVLPTLSQLTYLGLVDTYDRRATDAADPLVGYEEALRRNRSFYVTGEVGLNSTEFMIGEPTLRRSVYSNPFIDLSRPFCIYVVTENRLDGVHRRAVSEYVVVASGAGVATWVVPWWWWLLIFLAVLGVAAIVLLAVILCWMRWRRRGTTEKQWLGDGRKLYAARTTDDPGKRSSPGATSALAVSYLDTVIEDRRRRHGRVSSGRPGLDSHSDTDGDWSFVEPRPIYDSDASSMAPRRRSRCVPVTELLPYCERRLLADNGRALADEFCRLPDGFTGPVSAATRPSSVRCNRSQDCVPYDHNRVRLSSGQYINASVVRTIGRRHFIVTQYPTAETLTQFWQLVWERNVDVIVALLAVDEPDCHPYWPAELNQAATLAVPGDISIELAGAGVLAHFVVRELLLERRGEAGRRRVAHWQYTWWCGSDAETSIPCHPVDFVDFIQRVRDDDDYGDAGGVLVHCGSGGGRCGLYLAVDALLDQGFNTGVVDVIKCVSLLRTERCSLVRSLRQYNFIYQCLCEQFDHPQTRFSAQNFIVEPRPDEFKFVFMPDYFDAMRPGQPARRRTRYSFSICHDEATEHAAEDSDASCDVELDENPAVTFDGFVQRSVFVVSQCPRPLDADGFWDVVTESGVSCIVSLGVIASLLGNDLVVPQVPGCSINTRRHLVECQSVEKSSKSVYVVMELNVLACDGGRVLEESRRSLKLFEFVSWPGDRSVPSVDAMLQFTTLVRCWQRRTNSPVLVFGTAQPSDVRRDRSRAAVFTALWRLMEQAELDSVVDVFATTRLACILLPSALINEDQYRLLYAAMKEFLRRPEAYVLGRDCRAFPPTSLTQHHIEAQRTLPGLASTSARHLAPVTSVWPAMTPPDNKLVRGPWFTPDTQLDRSPYGAAGNRLYPSTIQGEWRRPGRYQQQTAMDAGGLPAGCAWIGARPATRDGAELNVSMNRATSDDQQDVKFVRRSSSALDIKQQLTSASAAHGQSSAPTVAVAGQHANQTTSTTSADDYHDRLLTSPEHDNNVATDRRSETLIAARTMTTTSGPLTSTPVDHSAPAGK